ncbi:c-14 sterol reductase [Moniliophthora roreri MCA 2997]|uniref:Delta(14)-sterol reductase n=2 Tax=Moniliophthora roreri TaxID=221103 RepID=V2Y1S2_MONRO|nr:c-14 sterol reductase [Moniliophthora roreri MCA 2997]KAI3615949.1 c-14 sterol reductase [Moniliophthora roreri]
MAKPKPSDAINPRTTEYDFSGPVGALASMIFIPINVYLLYYSCSEETGGCLPKFILDNTVGFFKKEAWWMRLWDTEAAVTYLGWYAFCFACWMILPGEVAKGTRLRDGTVKEYKINGFGTFILAIGLAVGSVIKFGPDCMTFLYHKWVGFITAALLLALVESIYVYAMSFRPGKLLALGGNSGNVAYDFFIGRELNPSIGSFDLMFFNKLRPGLILWALIDISMVCEQAVRRGGFSKITDSMWLTSVFHIFYVADAIYNEPAILTTIDIIADGLGFMLIVDDLVWVPFTYTMQTRYLAFNHVELGPIYTTIILALNSLGYWMFRSANVEKNDFRNGKNPKNLKYMTTESGSKLLISGWWGLSRHPNYIGDILMAITWSLPTGFSTPITYFYPMFFIPFMMHRQARDDAWCQKKYGKDWDKYKALVPYKIIPYVY